jgi:hypothetical protein
MLNSDQKADLKGLIDFLQKTRTVLRATVDAREVLFRETMRNLFRDAHNEIDQLIESIVSDLDSDLDASNPRTNFKALDEAGLTGTQLTLKLTGFGRAFDRFKQRGTLTLLHKVLSWINKILGSLTSAIPGSEAIKEFKEAVEEELDDSDSV